MGYQRKRKFTLLTWGPDQELHGLEVKLSGLSVGRFLQLASLADTLDTKNAAAVASQIGEVSSLFGEFAACLVEWNLEDDAGQPVPATLDGVKTQDLDFVLNLVMTWMEAVASVDTPLPASSNGGPNLMPEVSIPMAPLSPSPAN